jgi:hypothetical protein
MPLQSQYLADIGLDANPYPHHPESRIRQMFSTCRRGSVSYCFAMDIWNRHLVQLHSVVVAGALPPTQGAYDDLVVEAALGLGGWLSTLHKGDFGIGQKIVNLFMKDLWALGVILPPFENFLHAPIDRRVLGKFKTIPTAWNPWTKAVAGSSGCPTVAGYLSLQEQFRDFCCESPIRFPSVIQMEQFLWHQIP